MVTIPLLIYNDYKKPFHVSDTFFLNNLRIAKSSNVMERLLQEATLSFHYQIPMEPTSIPNCWKHQGAVCSENCLQRPCHFPQHLWGASVLVSYFPSKQNYWRNMCGCVLLPHIPGMSSDHLDLGKKKKRAKNWQPGLPHQSPTNYILLSTLRNRYTNQENVQLARGLWMAGEAFNHPEPSLRCPKKSGCSETPREGHSVIEATFEAKRNTGFWGVDGDTEIHMCGSWSCLSEPPFRPRTHPCAKGRRWGFWPSTGPRVPRADLDDRNESFYFLAFQRMPLPKLVRMWLIRTFQVTRAYSWRKGRKLLEQLKLDMSSFLREHLPSRVVRSEARREKYLKQDLYFSKVVD